jgi:tetratricopeptide (TPR) repeat protein
MIAWLRSGDWDFAAVRFPALGAISEHFLPYHPPRSAWVPEPEFEMYQHVLRAACRMLDRLLYQLVQAAGNEAAVLILSPHGVRRETAAPPASTRGDPEAWKSPYGIFAACGPGFAPDALVFGATVLDIAPTVLTWFGLPIGDDMEGRVLLEAFSPAPEVARVPSWESASAESAGTAAAMGRDASPRRPPASEAGRLGETPLPEGAPASQAAARLQRESDWNLAQSFVEAGRYQEALPVLEQLFRTFPERAELAHTLFQCQMALSKLAEASETLEVILEAMPAGAWTLLLRAELCLAKRQGADARKLVHQVWDMHPTQPAVMRRLGMLLLQLREWNPLADLAREALKLDENEPLAWLGLAEAQLRLRHPAEAEEAAMRAIGLNYYYPQAHFVLARALIAQSKWQQAREVMQTLLRIQPNNRAAASYARRLEQQPPSRA